MLGCKKIGATNMHPSSALSYMFPISYNDNPLLYEG